MNNEKKRVYKPLAIRKALTTDGYKLSHFEQYPKTLTSIYGNLTARSEKNFKQRLPSSDNKYVVAGIWQAMVEINDIFQKEFFSVSFDKAIGPMKKTIENYTKYKIGYENCLKRIHKLGYLPIKIRSIKEGTSIDINMPAITIQSEDVLLFSFLEPMITNMTWKTKTNDTNERELYITGMKWSKKTGNVDAVPYQFHDFSTRGMSGIEDACRSNVSHLIAFRGTESTGVLTYIEDVYDWDYKTDGALAGTIEATEHSVASTNIMYEKAIRGCDLEEAEYHYFKRYITEVYPNGYVGYVADTFDFFRTISVILPKLKSEVMARDGKLVIRPDSFEPIYGLCGLNLPYIEEPNVSEIDYDLFDNLISEHSACDSKGVFRTDKNVVTATRSNGVIKLEVREMTNEEMGTVQILWNTFGGTLNENGYRDLDSHIGVIYGDGINNVVADEIFKQLAKNKFSSTNVVVGIGAGAYQWVSRDTLGIAYKATQVVTSDIGAIDVYKDPVGGFKKSATGLLAVNKVDGDWFLTQKATIEQEEKSEMYTVFDNGSMPELKFATIRDNFIKDNENMY